jgi:large subunit ribosomal protein L30
MPSATPKDTDSAAGAEKKTAAKKTTKKTTTAAKKKTVKKTAAAGEKKTAKKATTVAKKKTVKKAAEKAPKNTQRLRVRQVKSGIRHPWRMRRTLTALGLKHHQDEVVVPDNPSIRGMLQRVHHLISVTPEDTNG